MITNSMLYSQVDVVRDSLDSPIDMAFINDDVYVALQGQNPTTGKIITFSVIDQSNSYTTLIDSLPYPRSIAIMDSVVYVGFPSSIKTLDLKKSIYLLNDLPIDFEDFSFPKSLKFVNETLFFAENSGISKIDFNNSPLQKEFIVSDLSDIPLSIEYYNEKIFLGAGKSIFTYDLESNELIEIISDLEHEVYSLLIIEGYLYIDQGAFSYEQEDILVFNLNDPNLTSMLFCDDIISVVGLTEYDKAIYLARQKPNFDGVFEGQIIRLNKQIISNSKNIIKSSLEVYPNPTSNEVYISLSSSTISQIQLIDATGVLIKIFTDTNRIELGECPRGLYYIKILDKTHKEISIEKIIKS